MKQFLFFLFGNLFFVLISNAQPGKLDSSFGTDGIVETSYAGLLTQFNSMAVQANDKIITSSYVSSLSVTGTLLAQYKPDGMLDTSFGIEGFSALNNMVRVSGLAIQPDRKIVIAGYMPIKGTGKTTIALLRFLPDGSLDSSFANNGEYLDNTGRFLSVSDVAIQLDGKIVISGNFNKDPERGIIYQLLERFNVDGSLDMSFGDSGEKIYYLATVNCFTNAIALQENGKIVAGGFEGIGALSDHFYLACYLPNGEPDSSFGINGEVITDFATNGEHIEDILIQSDGKIVAGGTGNDHGFGNPFPEPYMAVARYNSDGSLDNEFGNKGRTKATFDGSASGNSLVLDKDGKIVISGLAAAFAVDHGNLAVARFLDNGIPDSTFGNYGKTITARLTIIDDQTEIGIGIQKTGNILVAGHSLPINTILARYLGDPTKPRPTIAQIKRWIRNHILHFEDANTNAAYYVIEKSTASNTGFVPVTKITANAATSNYSYTLPESATQSTYRIKAVNKDNSITYSSPISSSDPAKAGVASFKIYPNPAKDRITVETSGTVQLRVQNSNGRVLLIQTVSGKGSIDISKLPVGVYYVVNTVNDESLKVVKE